MTETPDRTSTGSPKADPPSKAILPAHVLEAQLKHVRAASQKLEQQYEDLRARVAIASPDEDESDTEGGIRLAELEIEKCDKDAEEIRLERVLNDRKLEAKQITQEQAEEENKGLKKRLFSVGDIQWQHRQKKMRLGRRGYSGPEETLDPDTKFSTSSMLALYKRADGKGGQKMSRPNRWRENALEYYEAGGSKHGVECGDDAMWCHIMGKWLHSSLVKTAHIVPFFLNHKDMTEALFGDRATSLKKPGNALFMLSVLKGFFDEYKLVILPVDATEIPITRWKMEITDFRLGPNFVQADLQMKSLDGKELQFKNNNRPCSRFLYFRFLMALIRMKDIGIKGWQDAWAKYYTQRPFPTPGRYMRRGMIATLARYCTDDHTLGSWFTEYGFDSALVTTPEEDNEVARRVLEQLDDDIEEARRERFDEDN